MSHFAEIENNIVTRVIVAEQSFIDTLDNISDWKQTSYNGNFRKNYAGIGYTYDETLDAFISPTPFTSWVLDEETCRWEAPIPYPEVTEDSSVMYIWDEETIQWIRIDETVID